MIDKGLVTFVVEKGRRGFKIGTAHMLVEIFEEKGKNIEKKRKKAEKIAKEIENISKKIKYKQEATVYRGVKGIRSFYQEVLRIGKEYIVFGAPQESLDVMGNIFWANYNKKLADSKIKCKLIFNQEIRAHGEKTKTKFIQVKYFDKDFEPFTETNIQRDRVAIIVWTEEPMLFLIQDKHVAESYREFFEKMWKEAIS